MFNSYNPYYMYTPSQTPRMNQQFAQPQQTNLYNPQFGLQGKSVDSLEVVKAMDIPLDGSISYFPLIDGSSIVTKQLQQDGTSKTIIYKPVEGGSPETNVKYVTPEDLEKLKTAINADIKGLDKEKELKDLKEELKSLKKQIRFFMEDRKED